MLTDKKCSKVISLNTVYKTNYSTFEGYMAVDASLSLPLRYMLSSNSGNAFDAFVNSGVYSDHIAKDN